MLRATARPSGCAESVEDTVNVFWEEAEVEPVALDKKPRDKTEATVVPALIRKFCLEVLCSLMNKFYKATKPTPLRNRNFQRF